MKRQFKRLLQSEVNMRRMLIGGGMMMVMAISRMAVADAPAAQSATARGTMEQFIARVMAVLEDKTLSTEAHREKVRQIAYEGLDFETLSRLTLGRNWRTLNDAQRAEFMEAYKQHLASTYGHTTDSYTNESISVNGEQAESNGDVTVNTQIIGDKDGKRQEVAKVNYRMRQKDGAWKVIDVIIDGISLMANFRSQFQSVIDNGGFDKLMMLLRDKNAKDAVHS